MSNTSWYAYRRGKYVDHMGKYDFPVPLQTVGSFALRNNMSIIVYGVDADNEVIYPLRISSTLVPDRQADLLLFERDRVHHYTIIRNFSRLVGRKLSSHERRPLLYTIYTRLLEPGVVGCSCSRLLPCAKDQISRGPEVSIHQYPETTASTVCNIG